MTLLCRKKPKFLEATKLSLSEFCSKRSKALQTAMLNLTKFSIEKTKSLGTTSWDLSTFSDKSPTPCKQQGRNRPILKPCKPKT